MANADRPSPTDGIPSTRPGMERPNGFTAVNGAVEGNPSSGPASEGSRHSAPPARESILRTAYTSGDMNFPRGGIRLDNIRNEVDEHTIPRRLSYGSPPPKRKRTEEPPALSVRTAMAEAAAPIHIKDSPDSQAREVINLTSPVQPPGPALEMTRLPYHDSQVPTFATHANNKTSWNSEHVRQDVGDDQRRSSDDYNKGPSQERGVDSSDDDLGPGHNTDGGRRTKRQFSHRTKTGCLTCRRRKKKCDEAKPYCQNCTKGKFNCEGYGLKPLGNGPDASRSRHNAQSYQLQVRPEYAPSSASGRPPTLPEHQWHNGPYQSYPGEPRRNGQQYGATQPPPPPPPPQSYGPPSHDPRDPWSRQPYNDATHIHLQGNKLGAVDYAQLNVREYHHKEQRPPHPTHPPEPFPPQFPQRGPPPPPPYPPFESREGSMTIDRRAGHFQPMLSQQPQESPNADRERMLIGQPYKHWKDGKLIADRLDCKTAVDLYNRAALPSEALSQDERASRFTAILNPSKRSSAHGDAATVGRIGRCGERTIVEAPFYCDYGYNLIIGHETVIYPNCFIQDPCEIIIGNKCIIGPNVSLLGMTASIDFRNRQGSQGTYLGGSITIEDNCWIGAGVVVMPYRIIGTGAIVGAGSVVTRNVKPYTIVAGNPAKEVRSLNESTIDRRMRTEIQQENEHMIEEMKRRRYLAPSDSAHPSRTMEQR